jgi:hypothetical protein
VLPGEKVFCPMTTIAGVRDRIAGLDEDDVLAQIEETGGLAWAWNIASDLSGAREVRVLTRCVEHFSTTGKPLKWSFERVLDEIFAGFDKAFLQGTRVKLMLNCSSTHVINLILAKALKTVPGTSWNTGPAGSPVITRESFVQFLNDRRLP